MPLISIGSVNIANPVCLAPMAGVSNVTYRGICHEFGSAYAPTELCSARSIKYNGIDKSFRYLEIDPGTEGITAIQLFGADPEDFEYAVEAICNDDRLSQVSIIDINMGCPVPKVVKTGSGSALLKTPDIASDIVRATKRAADKYGKPVTVKTRTSFLDEEPAQLDFIKGLCEAGADMICVHGRSAKQMYHGFADREKIRLIGDVVKGYNIPYFANGDITNLESARSMIDETGADGIMVGRAATGNPWIFREIVSGLWDSSVNYEAPSDIERKQMLLREIKGTCNHLPEVVAVREARAVMTSYVKGMRGAATLKVELCKATTVSEIEEILFS